MDAKHSEVSLLQSLMESSGNLWQSAPTCVVVEGAWPLHGRQASSEFGLAAKLPADP